MSQGPRREPLDLALRAGLYAPSCDGLLAGRRALDVAARLRAARRPLTIPLWGVGTTGPYGHDGRSINLPEVILRHGGEAQRERDLFAALGSRDQDDVVAFLNSLVIFPPGDTPSNLDPGNRATAGYPQFDAGSIRLGALFNDPTDPE